MVVNNISELYRLTLIDRKWFKFLKLVRWLRAVPFIEIIFATGSMAVGHAQSDSDFDVLIQVKPGRIFTVRFFANIILGLPNFRRRPRSSRSAQADKICLSHFITSKVTDHGLPFDSERAELYHHLIPLLGSVAAINNFYHRCLITRPLRHYTPDMRHRYYGLNRLGRFLELILAGRLGYWLEIKLRSLQVARIKSSLRLVQVGPRGVARFTDQEIKFHY